MINGATSWTVSKIGSRCNEVAAKLAATRSLLIVPSTRHFSATIGVYGTINPGYRRNPGFVPPLGPTRPQRRKQEQIGLVLEQHDAARPQPGESAADGALFSLARDRAARRSGAVSRRTLGGAAAAARRRWTRAAHLGWPDALPSRVPSTRRPGNPRRR